MNATAAQPARTVDRLIAHRGGIVDGHLAEQSLESLEAAIGRGYWMAEIDVRSTRDGVPLAQHDPDFMRFYGDARKVADLTFAETQTLRTDTAGLPPVPLENIVRVAHGRINLMLDFKEPHEIGLCERVEEILRKWNMLSECHIIGTDAAREYFAGKAWVGSSYKPLLARVAGLGGKSKPGRYFLFVRGMNMTTEMIAWADRHGLPVIPYVNEYHYPEGDVMAQAHREIQRLKAAGVRIFQIDSNFDIWFRPASLAK